MRIVTVTPLLLAVLASSLAGDAVAQSPAQQRAAQMATQQAKAVTLRDLRGGKPFGTIRLQRIGRTHTRVTLRFTGTRNPRSIVTLHRGTDCNDPRYAAASQQYALNPVNSSTQVSQTVVDLPITDLQSGNYLVDVRNATQTQQFLRACARLRR